MQRGHRRVLLVVVAFLLFGGGLVYGAAKPSLRVVGCAGAVFQDGRAFGGCPPLKMTGAIATNLASSGDVLHFLSNNITVETYRVTSSGKFTRVGCYGRESLLIGAQKVPTGCTPGPFESNVDGAASYFYSPLDVITGPNRTVYISSEARLGAHYTGKVESLTQAADGSLRFIACVANDAGPELGSPCTLVKNFSGPGRLAAAPSGKRVYAVTATGVWSIDRSGDGRLSAVGCVPVLITKCAPTDGSGDIDPDFVRIAVSPDSRFVYVDGTIVPGDDFARDIIYVYKATAGAPGLRLVQKQLLPRTFNGARDLSLSRNGSVLYAVAGAGVIGLARNGSTGRLSSVRACVANALSRRGDEFYVSGCQPFPLNSESLGGGSALERIANGALVLVAEGGAWLLTHDTKTKGFAIKACATVLSRPLCPERVKNFNYPPKDAAVMGNGTIVLSNDHALFALAASNTTSPGGVRPPSQALPKICSLVTNEEAQALLRDPAADSRAWPRWCEYSNPNGATINRLLVMWSPNERMSDGAYRKQISLYGHGNIPGVGDFASGSYNGAREARILVFAKHRMLETQLCCFGKESLARLKTVTALAVKRLPG